MARGPRVAPMRVTVSVAAGDEREVALADVADERGPSGADPTYGDLLAAVDLSPQEATVLVDGRPVPDDAPVEADRVEVLRLIQGG